MKHGLLALAALLGVAVVTAQAEYFRFIYNPGVVKKNADLPPDPNAPPGQNGQNGAGGIPPQVMNQLPPNVQAQLRGLSPQQQRAALQKFAPGLAGGAGGLGNRTGRGPNRRGGGAGAGMGMGMGMPSAPGMTPGGGGMAAGLAGGMGTIGVGEGPAGMPGMPGMTADPNASQDEEELDMDAVKVEVIVEVVNNKIVLWKELSPGSNKTLKVQHKWGLSAVDYNDLKERDIIVQRITEPDSKGKGRHVGLLPLKMRWENELKKAQAMKGFPTVEKLLELAEYALVHGLQQQFDEQMAELVKLKPDHPSAKAYKQYVDVDFKKTNLKDDPASAWSDKLGDFKTKRTDHFLVRYDASTAAQVVDNYARLLEDNYRAFFSWFALKGKHVPTPEYRLAAVLSDKPDDFNSLHKVFDTITLPVDAFMSRRDNLSVMAGTPLDEGYETFNRATQDLWLKDGWNPDLCLKGDYKARGGKSSTHEISYAHTAALMLQGMRDQSERQAVTHVGTVQLATACGLLPRTVTAPRWVQFGVGSFFETPREAYWPGTAAPHWNYLTKFQLWHEAKKLDKPEEALKRVVTDSYFHDAHGDKEARNDHERDVILKARTMTWALTYFLAQQRLDQLLKYYQELAAMPRDMELGEEALAAVFAKAFDLGEGADAFGGPKAKELAQKWYEFLLRDTHVEVAEVKTLAKKREETRVKRLQDEARHKALAQEQAKAQAQAQAQMQTQGVIQQGMMQPGGISAPGMAPGMTPGMAPGAANQGMQRGLPSKFSGSGKADR